MSDVPFFFKHFRDVAYSFVQNISHAGVNSSHPLVNEIVFVHVLIWSLNWIVHILEGHVQEKRLFWVMGIDYLFHSLMKQNG